MHIYPETNVKTLSECEHGEFVSVQTPHGALSVLCIHEEGKRNSVLVLGPQESSLIYKLIPLRPEDEVLAYGTNWTLLPIGRPLGWQEAGEKPGTFIQSGEGLFIVGIEHGNFQDLLLCRLDDVGVLTSMSIAHSAFAFPQWRIILRDEDTPGPSVLASNETTPTEAEDTK